MVEETKTQEAPATNFIDAANAASERLEKANIEHKALIEKEEKMMAMRMLGGRADAGQAPAPVLSEEEKLRAETREYFKGSAIERYVK